MSCEMQNIAGAETFDDVEGNMCGVAMRDAVAPSGSKTPSRAKRQCRNLGDLAWPTIAEAVLGRDRKSRRRSCRGTGEESDGPIVPVKRSNKPAMSGGGERGGKEPGRREGGRQRMLRTLCRSKHATYVARLRIGTIGDATS